MTKSEIYEVRLDVDDLFRAIVAYCEGQGVTLLDEDKKNMRVHVSSPTYDILAGAGHFPTGVTVRYMRQPTLGNI